MNIPASADLGPTTDLTQLVLQEGRLRVLRALLASLLRKKRPPPLPVADLPDYLLRDIGLAERGPKGGMGAPKGPRPMPLR